MSVSKSVMIFSGLAAATLVAGALVLALDLFPNPFATPAPAPAPVQKVNQVTVPVTTPAEAPVEALVGPSAEAPVAATPQAAPVPAQPQPASVTAAPAKAAAEIPLPGPGEAQAAPVPGGGAALAWKPGAPWNFKAYQAAMRQSGRESELPESTFAELQARKATAMLAIESYLKRRFGKADENVLRAFRELPREYFHYDYQRKKSFASNCYEPAPKPWAIGYGSALSDYLGQAYMTQLCRPRPGDTVLEIGTGSGFQSSLLSRIVKSVYSVEIIKPLGTEVARIYQPLGLDNVRTRVGDGYFGWPEVEGGFDIIMVTCVARYVSPELLKQLKPEGRLIVPIGQPFKKGQVLYVFTKDKAGKVHSRKDMGVFFIPMTGKILAGTP